MFWNQLGIDPRRSYRFRLRSTKGLSLTDKGVSDVWWSAKKIDKPSFSVTSNKYRLINHEINMPGLVSWNPITVELADIGNSVRGLLEQLEDFGYSPKDLAKDEGLTKTKGFSHLGEVNIEQFDGDGTIIETWKLEGAYITELRFGNLDYTSDEIVNLTMTITYDHAYLD